MPSLEMKPRILIICPSFPPNPGIGGRRWAKFAKILFQQGYDVWVFSFKLPNRKEISHWTKDVEELQKNSRIIEVDRNYPAILDEYPKSISGKLKYKFWDNYLKFKYKGNIYDRSLRWGKFLIPKLRKKIDTNTVIIGTGAPFRYLKDLIALKDDFPVKLISDFRDPWANNTIAYNKGLSKKRLEFEKYLEKNVAGNFDKIFCVDKFHIKYFKKELNISADKLFLIPNGYDPNERILTPISQKTNSSKVKLVFAGTLYHDAQEIFEEFGSFLDELVNMDLEVYKQLEFHFFGQFLVDFTELQEKHACVKFFGVKPLDIIHQEIANSDAVMIFLTNQLNYTFNTKVLEAFNQKKKILVFSNSGYLEKFVEENEVGYSLVPEKMHKSFTRLIKDKHQNKLALDPIPEKLKEFDVNNILKTILEEIE